MAIAEMARAQCTPKQEDRRNQERQESTMHSHTKCRCPGDGWILLDGKTYRCPCSIERKLAACLPEKYRIARLKDFNGAIRQFIKSWVQKPTAGLFIFGRVGTGKTHLVAAILRVLLEVRARVDFRRCAQFFADLQESYRANTSSEAIVDDLENSQFLILDDVGSGALSDHERRFTLELIERRINQNRPTILTSNWSRQEIGEKMDARISSRLALFTELELSGADLREVRGDSPLEIKSPMNEAAAELPMTEAERRELSEVCKALKGKLGLLVRDDTSALIRTKSDAAYLLEAGRQKAALTKRGWLTAEQSEQ